MLRRRRRKVRQIADYDEPARFTLSPEVKRGIVTIVIFTFSFLGILSFFDAAGSVGAFIGDALAALFGRAQWIVPFILLILGYFLLQPDKYVVSAIRYIGAILIITSASGLFHMTARTVPLDEIVRQGIGGGYVGYGIGGLLYRSTDLLGSVLILTAALIAGLFIFFNTTFRSILILANEARRRVSEWRARQTMKTGPDDEVSLLAQNAFKTQGLEDRADETLTEEDEGEELEDARLPLKSKAHADETELPRSMSSVRRRMQKIDIPLDLLVGSADTPSSGDIAANIKKIEATLRSFGIEVTMGEVHVGPTVTQYTLKPMEGIKISQIATLHADLALALAAHPIRIEAPIPNKALVGIEVPNQTISVVKLKEVLQSSAFVSRKTNLMIALGKDVAGTVILEDLSRMPHLLIAGATGSGKSVCINSILIGLLYQNSPEDLKLILIDPKRVELTAYDGVPQLLTPVITDVDKTINALRWTVQQMDERYKLLSAAGKRNIESYNSARLLDKMPYIVIIIDELADLMTVAAKEVESAIIRLAQMARAVGIHLVLATQRPSVNVITGLIKANITSRIAFSVASATDSRTILDSSGAEKLLGRGDMLFTSAELSKPKRIQGAFISEKEVSAVVSYLRERGEPSYDTEIVERRHGKTVAGSFESEDEDIDVQRATEVVVRAKRASATLLQSRMRVGFAKASRLLDLLEERGIIGPQNSSKPREVLITEEELSDYRSDGATKDYDINKPDDESDTDGHTQ